MQFRTIPSVNVDCANQLIEIEINSVLICINYTIYFLFQLQKYQFKSLYVELRRRNVLGCISVCSYAIIRNTTEEIFQVIKNWSACQNRHKFYGRIYRLFMSGSIHITIIFLFIITFVCVQYAIIIILLSLISQYDHNWYKDNQNYEQIDITIDWGGRKYNILRGYTQCVLKGQLLEPC